MGNRLWSEQIFSHKSLVIPKSIEPRRASGDLLAVQDAREIERCCYEGPERPSSYCKFALPPGLFLPAGLGANLN